MNSVLAALASFAVAVAMVAAAVAWDYPRFWLTALLFLAVGSIALGHGRNVRRLMKALGVDEASMDEFDRERKGPGVRSAGRVIFTDNWVYHDSLFAPKLLPMKKIMFFKKEYGHSRYGSTFCIALMFGEDMECDFPCDFENLDAVAALLSQRCPQANQREWGTFL